MIILLPQPCQGKIPESQTNDQYGLAPIFDFEVNLIKGVFLKEKAMTTLKAQQRDTERVGHMFDIALKILGGLVIATIALGMMFP